MTNAHKKGRTKHCTICACEFTRIKGMTDEEWKDRNVCYTTSCEEMAKIKQPRKQLDPTERLCPCGKPLIRRSQEAFISFDNRKYCSMSCRNIYRYADLVKVKNCRICGKEFTRRADEPANNFNKRKLCDDPKCKSEMHRTRGERNAQKNPSQTYLPIPAPLIRSADCLITRVEMPLERGVDLYRLRVAVGWLMG
jgi:hypothetical protein